MTLHEQIWRLGVTLHAYGYGGKIAFDLDKYPNPENRPCIKVFGGQTDIINAYISQDGGEMQFTHPQGATMSVFPRAATEQDLIVYGIDAILPQIYKAIPESEYMGDYGDFLSMDYLPPKETWVKKLK